MSDDRDTLLEMFKHYMSEGRYHLDQRANTSNILLILATSVIGFIGIEQRPPEIGTFAGLFLMVLGVFGVIWSIKHHERYDFYLQRARGYRDELNKLLSPLDMNIINANADKITKEKWRLIYRTPNGLLWLTPHLLVVVIGICLIFLFR